MTLASGEQVAVRPAGGDRAAAGVPVHDPRRRWDWQALAPRLDWSVVACLNLGIARAGLGDGAHWIYFPDDDVPFYRVGFPSNFSETVAPPGASSMYVEFGLGKDEEYDPVQLERRPGARSAGYRAAVAGATPSWSGIWYGSIRAMSSSTAAGRTLG